jgi:ABC-type transport system involved in multi-copper enzyme maturation permease subunit
MTGAVTSLWRLLNPARLTGPLFDKELRVSSRRKRNYVLRFVYVALLTAFVAVVWHSMVVWQVSTTFQKSRMALAGKTITSTIVVFQFAATQLIAIIMLSNSISDEIYHQTLGLLMTTPISSFQIVMGKLSSKLLQLVLLLAISLPLLGIIRIFGGVPWTYVLSSLCITLTAVIFAGALSLFFSISNRRAYVVIIKTIATVGLIFGLLPMIIGLLRTVPMTFIGLRVPRPFSYPVFWHALSHLSPFYAMSFNTALLMSPSLPAGVARFYWPVHCAVMLGLSGLLIAVCTGTVRRVALRQATGQSEHIPKRRRRTTGNWPGRTARSEDIGGVVRRVRGWPVFWKDVRAPLIQGFEGRNSIIGLVVTIGALLLTYGAWAREGYLDEDFTHVSYAVMFILIATVFHIVFSASSIASEKESRAWPLLLATSMDDWQILAGKAAAVFLRCSVVWLLLAGHVVVFVFVGYIHPIAIVHLLMLVAWLVVFLTSAGLYFSAGLRRTTSSVVATFALALALWVVAPMVLGLMATISRSEQMARIGVCANPVVQAAVIMHGAGGRYNAHAALAKLRYDWIDESLDAGSTTAVLAVTMLIYASLGLLFAWRAKRRFRRNIF